MGRYSSESETSCSDRNKKSKRSSRRSSSRSRSPKRCKKKMKKYKRENLSASKDKSRHSSVSKSKYRQRTRSPSERRKKRSSSRDSDRRRKDGHRKSKHSKSKRRYRSSSKSSSRTSSSVSSRSKSPSPRRKFDYDPDELLEKLNKAAVEAMAANKKFKSSDSLTTEGQMRSIEMQIKRQDIINDLRASGSGCLIPQTPDLSAAPKGPTLPVLSTKLSDKTLADNLPVIVDLSVTTATVHTAPEISKSSDSLLHPNFLLENQEDKLNRWVKKLFQIRQRAIFGEIISA